jgi:hypothetical protein
LPPYPVIQKINTSRLIEDLTKPHLSQPPYSVSHKINISDIIQELTKARFK